MAGFRVFHSQVDHQTEVLPTVGTEVSTLETLPDPRYFLFLVLF